MCKCAIQRARVIGNTTRSFVHSQLGRGGVGCDRSFLAGAHGVGIVSVGSYCLKSEALIRILRAWKIAMTTLAEGGEPKLYTTAVHSETSKTFVFVDEDHTLGNALRYTMMRDPSTTFCGYTVPHPSENKLHIRVQTKAKSAEDTLLKGATDLSSMCDTILSRFDGAVQAAGVE